MEQTGQQELFEIRLNASGKHYIRRFAGVVRVIILISIIISLLYIVSTLIEVIKLDHSIYSGNKLLLFRRTVTPFYVVVYLALFAMQIYYYWKMTRSALKGVDYNDEEEFNRSFRSLYRHAIFGALTLGFSILLGFFDFYLMIKYYLN
ncbi:MAG: hypothetical protein JNN00_16130 [Chitinophagaceae bacterium]|nr:hypothetical protein [Chitinophagaceae bacterium]